MEVIVGVVYVLVVAAGIAVYGPVAAADEYHWYVIPEPTVAPDRSSSDDPLMQKVAGVAVTSPGAGVPAQGVTVKTVTLVVLPAVHP